QPSRTGGLSWGGNPWDCPARFHSPIEKLLTWVSPITHFLALALVHVIVLVIVIALKTPRFSHSPNY
ncbi:MAG TPA: hypothetical protein PLI07_10160, partial [Candidatus Hydrogenedentes bacterium]|nr:hypothetical protein [Candidatus Hydrogenedentota bacterium]